jgi:hypothetical protein
VLCVGAGASAFCLESLDLGGVGGESFDVIACWLVAVTFKPPDTEGRGAVLEFLFLLRCGAGARLLDRVVDYGHTA